MNRPLKLNKRLTAAAEQVRPGAVAADIGTDHGYLACALVLSGRCRKVYAADLNREPLERAEATIAAYGLKEAVIPLLSDGVQNLPAEEVTDFVIAGMGGDLIGSILMDERLYDPAKRFILQPMTKADVLRRTLYRNGFALTEESAVQDARFVYSVMTAVIPETKRRSTNGSRAPAGWRWLLFWGITAFTCCTSWSGWKSSLPAVARRTKRPVPGGAAARASGAVFKVFGFGLNGLGGTHGTGSADLQIS